MWFSQAEAQFRRARITAETTMYDYVLMKLPQDVVMLVRSLVSAIEADPVKQEASYTLMKEALLGSYGMTKWQMAYSLLDHPDLGDSGSRPPPLTPCSLLCFSIGCRLPSGTISPRRTTQRRQRWQHTRIFSGMPGTQHQYQLFQIPSPPCQFAPLCQIAAPSLQTAAPGHLIAAAAVAASRPAAPHPAGQMARGFAGFTRSTGLTPQAAAQIVSGRKTRSPPWAAQCSRRPHLSPGFGL
jgi:hypothetical protein